MNSDSNDPNKVVTPPPHIVERLQRRSNSRRRSSAHSSRRNSISSLHSRSSQLSSHGGPYSTHIAQHLRRASIIESRKARLAERAAHAEQVRLRAAAAKAAPRTSTNSEEKALAAQVAREKLLAEITARCEEEVRRAKRIAEETKEKKAAEHARLRDEMAEKFADAARRRSDYQMNFRRPRTISLAAVEERKVAPQELKRINQQTAVRIIQRSWRRFRPRFIARGFIKTGVSITELSEVPFEDVTKLISSESTMYAAMRFASHLGMLDHENDENARRGSIRVLLGAFMVVAHPVQAFSHGGKEPQEQDLIARGTSLVKAIETTRNDMLDCKTPTIAADRLQSLFLDFTSGFHAWKTQDLGIIADVMVGSFVNLDLIIQATKEDNEGNVAEEYLQAIRTEQTKILVKLKRLIGNDKALDRIRKAVRKARRDRAAQHTTDNTNTVPRASTPVDMEIDLAPHAILTPPSTPARVQEHETASSFVTRLSHTMTVLPSNREISHEIQINGTFEIQQQPWTQSRKEFLDVIRKGMRATFQEGSIEGQSAWILDMVDLIKDKLMSLVTSKHPLYNRLESLLDGPLIDQQVSRNIFVFDEFFLSLGNMIKQICSPGRDDLVKEFIDDTSVDTIDRLFRLINILDLMTLDHINFQFRLASKQVVEHGHAHEHAMFEKDLENKIHGLRMTKNWWNAASMTVTQLPGTPSYANAVYARALTDTVLSNAPFHHNALPETLRLDYLRLLKLRAKLFQVVAVASTLLTSKIRLRRNRESLWTREAERLMKLDIVGTDVAAIVRQIESGHMMPDSTRSGLIDFVSRVLPPAAAASTKLKLAEEYRQDALQQKIRWSPDESQAEQDESDVFTEQVAMFILKSLREHIFNRLAASSTAEKVRITSSASEVLARIGMPEFVAEIGSAVDTLERVRSVDLKAHEKWYDLAVGTEE